MGDEIYTTNQIEGQDGLNVCTKDDINMTLFLDGMIYTFNDTAMIYMTEDLTDEWESIKEQRQTSIDQGINESGLTLDSKGTGPIPLYQEESGDDKEYEYYLFKTQADQAIPTDQYYFMKDGQVYGVYTKVTMDDSAYETTEIINLMTGQIPEGLIALPENFEDYELYEQ